VVVDLHEDGGYHFMMGGAADIRPFGEDVRGRHADIPKYRKAGVKLFLGSIFPLLGSLNLRKIAAMQRMYGHWSPSPALVSPRDVAIELVKVYYALEEMYPRDLKIVRTRDDIEGLGARVGIVLHIEGCEALGEPEDLRVFFNLGVRSVGLTWNYDNKFAASCLSKKDYGLTGEGEALVAVADKLGVMVDLSHSSPKTSSDTLAAADLPPFFSHSNSSSVQANPRNVSDQLIRETAKRRGVVGLTFIRSCIGSPFTLDRLSEHAKHMVAVGGGTLPALGTDLLGMSSTPVGVKDVSDVEKFRRALLRSGVPSETAESILDGNAFDFILKRSERW
jgi:membrane dipeptidase